jgi:hypothetical protein
MKVRQLIDGCVFGPQAIIAIGRHSMLHGEILRRAAGSARAVLTRTATCTRCSERRCMG